MSEEGSNESFSAECENILVSIGRRDNDNEGKGNWDDTSVDF